MQKFSFRVVAVCLTLVASLAFAQDEPLLTANAESSAMIEQYRKALDNLETPDAQAAALYQLLNFQLRFTDKAPAAETVKELIALAVRIEKVSLRTQLLEAAIFAQSELGDYDGAVKTTENILAAQARAEAQLNLAEKFLDDQEKKKSDKPFDVVALLRKAVDGAAEAKDSGLEALALAVLGGELLKTGNVDDAKTAFQKSRGKAAELEEIEERNVIGLIIRNNVRSSQTAEAVALVDSMKTDEIKAVLTGVIARTEISEGRPDAARKTIDSMKPGDARDSALIELGRQVAKTESAAALLELSKMMSMPERVEIFQQQIIGHLVTEKRFDVAGEFATSSAKPEDFQFLLSAHRLELLIDDKQFDDAEKLIETFTDPRLKTGAIHHFSQACVQAGETDKAERLLADSRSEEETEALKELAAAATKAVAETNLEIRTETLFEILQAQLQLLDFKGGRQTLVAITDSVRKVENPAKRVPYLLVLSRVLSELDKTQARTTLGELFTFLTDIKDPMELKELVPREQPDPMQPILVVDLPVEESAVKEQFFILYVNIANVLSKVDDGETAKKALAKATEMLAAEPEPDVKLQKMLFIAQIYAELQ